MPPERVSPFLAAGSSVTISLDQAFGAARAVPIHFLGPPIRKAHGQKSIDRGYPACSGPAARRYIRTPGCQARRADIK